MLGVTGMLYVLIGVPAFRIPFNMTILDVGTAALVAAMGFAHQRAEADNRKWKALLYRASQKEELSADDIQFLRLIIDEE